jgi:DNA-binding transcriptional LysR family regulator
MDSLRGMVSFVETARCGSFAGAAQVLGISSVAVSKNVSRLEGQLKQQLFARSTRKLMLTAQGEALLAQCQGPLAELASAFSGSRAASDAMQGSVRITAVSPFVRGYLAPQLLEFHRDHPKITLDIQPRNGSWTRPSGPRWAVWARRDDAAGSCPQGGATPPKRPNPPPPPHPAPARLNRVRSVLTQQVKAGVAASA